MTQKNNKKNYVLDTNVLIHDPLSIQRFEENDLYIPIYVLEEIDGLKTDMAGEKGRNAREIVRFIDDLRTEGNLAEGVKISDDVEGKLFVYVPTFYDMHKKPTPTPHGWVDEAILNSCMEVKKDKGDDEKTIFVTMDVNLRVRADALGLQTASYEYQSVNLNDLGNDIKSIDTNSQEIDKFFADKGNASFDLTEEELEDNGIRENDSVMLDAGSGKTALGRCKDGAVKPLRVPREGVMGVRPRNKEQAYAMDLLLDPDVKLVTIMGQAGTGKTLLTLAAGLNAVLEGDYDKLLVSRPIVPMGKDLGYLPGTIEEKMDPWMQPVYDNLDFLMMSSGKSRKFGQDDLFDNGQIQVEPLTYIRGRSIPNQFIIIDEAQNLTPHEVKTIITRCGEGTKIVFTGDPYQIDNPYINKSSNGLSVAVKKIIDEPSVGHLMLRKGERSELANIAVKYM